MNNFKKLLFLVSFTLFLLSCTEDEQVNKDCYTCENTQTEYCYTPGNDYFSFTHNNTKKTKHLNDSWNATKELLINMCENGDYETDCYTCELSNTIYCYTIGDNYYTKLFNDNEKSINLNDNSWISEQLSLQENCKASLTGTWKMTTYKVNSETTVSGQENPNLSETIGSNFDYTLIFNQESDIFSKSGSFNFITTTTDGKTWQAEENQGITSAFLIEGNWTKNNLDITYKKIVNENIVEEKTSKILEHTYNILEEEYTNDYNFEENGITYDKHEVKIITYQRVLD